jgi:hypothetical protein
MDKDITGLKIVYSVTQFTGCTNAVLLYTRHKVSH